MRDQREDLEDKMSGITDVLRGKQNPVNLVKYNCTCGKAMRFESVNGIVAPQRAWVGLTDEEISELIRATHNTGSFVRAIEAKLKEKNHYA